MARDQQQFYYKNNRLQQLRGFCYTAQFGSISRAAEHMGLNHSSVSIQIKTLAEELGLTLFERYGPRIALTGDGQKLYEKAKPCVESFDLLYESFHQNVRAEKDTHLHIAANSSAIHFILPEVTQTLLAEHKDCQLTLHLLEHDAAIEALVSKNVDLAVLPQRAHKLFPKTCKYIQLWRFPSALITKPDHPLAGRKNLTIKEISKYEIVLPAEDLQVIPNLYRLFSDVGLAKKSRLHFANLETGRSYIETGQAITISSTVWMTENDTLVATPLDHLLPNVDYGIVTRSEVPSEKIKTFISTVKRSVELT